MDTYRAYEQKGYNESNFYSVTGMGGCSGTENYGLLLNNLAPCFDSRGNNTMHGMVRKAIASLFVRRRLGNTTPVAVITTRF
jgi:hypothetical protein